MQFFNNTQLTNTSQDTALILVTVPFTYVVHAPHQFTGMPFRQDHTHSKVTSMHHISSLGTYTVPAIKYTFKSHVKAPHQFTGHVASPAIKYTLKSLDNYTLKHNHITFLHAFRWTIIQPKCLFCFHIIF